MNWVIKISPENFPKRSLQPRPGQISMYPPTFCKNPLWITIFFHFFGWLMTDYLTECLWNEQINAMALFILGALWLAASSAFACIILYCSTYLNADWGKRGTLRSTYPYNVYADWMILIDKQMVWDIKNILNVYLGC